MHWKAVAEVLGFLEQLLGPFLYHHVVGSGWSLFLGRVKAEEKLTHLTHLASCSTMVWILAGGTSLRPDAPALSEKSKHANIDTQFTGTCRHISTPEFWRHNKQIESSEALLGSKA